MCNKCGKGISIMDTRYYRVIVECGHVGCGKKIEITRFFKANDAIQCYLSALYMPRSKKKPNSVKLIEPIEIKEYLEGKQAEESNYYLNIFSPINSNLNTERSYKNVKQYLFA